MVLSFGLRKRSGSGMAIVMRGKWQPPSYTDIVTALAATIELASVCLCWTV